MPFLLPVYIPPERSYVTPRPLLEQICHALSGCVPFKFHSPRALMNELLTPYYCLRRPQSEQRWPVPDRDMGYPYPPLSIASATIARHFQIGTLDELRQSHPADNAYEQRDESKEQVHVTPPRPQTVTTR